MSSALPSGEKDTIRTDEVDGAGERVISFHEGLNGPLFYDLNEFRAAYTPRDPRESATV
jgi:hypothetical protein